MLTHANMVANVLQVDAWVARDLKDGAETTVVPLPLYHVFALTASLVFLRKGARTVLIANPRDLRGFVKTLREIPVTAMIGVNTLFRALLDAPDFDSVDLSRLKLAVAGGMAVQHAVAHRWKERTGVPLVEGYGLTETSPVAIANPLDIKEWSGLIGVPIPNTEAAILDDDGAPLPTGEVGEIALRGPQIMRGYWKRPEETAKVLTADGWLRTGDMGVMDERGNVRITDRKKDMIIVSGFKVFPNEIEDVLTHAPGRARGGGDRGARRARGRGGQGSRGAPGPGAHRSGGAGASAGSTSPATRCRGVIEFRDEPLPKTSDRQDPAARPAGRRSRGAATAAHRGLTSPPGFDRRSPFGCTRVIDQVRELDHAHAGAEPCVQCLHVERIRNERGMSRAVRAAPGWGARSGAAKRRTLLDAVLRLGS